MVLVSIRFDVAAHVPVVSSASIESRHDFQVRLARCST
jgi:hypothetical protein